MTNKEVEILEDFDIQRYPYPMEYVREFNKSLKMAVKTLKQEPCDDCISRVEVKKIAKEMYLEVANMELDVNTIPDCISYTSSK